MHPLMDAGLNLSALDEAADGLALVCDEGEFSRQDLARERRRLTDAFLTMGTRQALLHAELTLVSYAALLALSDLAIPTILVPPEPSAAVLSLAEQLVGADTAIRAGNVLPRPRGIPDTQLLAAGSVVMITSGTTGQPKVVRHSWSTLARAVRVRKELRGAVWLLAYPYHLYAGMQVVLHVLLNTGTMVMLPADRDVEKTIRRMVEYKATYVSGTPSFFRRLLLQAPRAALNGARLTQITLGGERVTQDIVSALREAFPSSRIVHIYASSELGRCFSVEDEQEGFPLALLSTGTKDGVRLRVRDGELEVQPVHAMNGYLLGGSQLRVDAGWVATGDLVEVAGTRVYFRGRRSDLINVGGSKVNPTAVEDVIRSCPGVQDVRVFGRHSALVGELVAADVVADKAVEEASLRATIFAHCVEHLSEPERPRVVRIVTSISVSDAGKVIRRTEGQ